MSLVVAILPLTFLVSCETSPKVSADTIVSRVIERSGGNEFDSEEMCFDFRNGTYLPYRKEGLFILGCHTLKEDTLTEDKVGNEGLSRLINDTPIEVPDSLANRWRQSVNSVYYVAYLPYGL